MTDQELKQQPKAVREAFEQIHDSEVDGDAQIVELKLKLKAALAKFDSANAEHDRLRSLVGDLQRDIDQAKLGIEDINEQRVEVIAKSLIDGDDFSADNELIARRLDLERLVERLTIARPAIERQQRERERAMEFARRPCSNIEDQINERRDELKLPEARRRHGYV